MSWVLRKNRRCGWLRLNHRSPWIESFAAFGVLARLLAFFRPSVAIDSTTAAPSDALRLLAETGP
jgi:hypothetical protein